MLCLPSILSAGLFAVGTMIPAAWITRLFDGNDTFTSSLGFIAACFLAQCYVSLVLYLPFAAVIMWWQRKKTVEQMREISWFLPLFFLLLCLPVFGFLSIEIFALLVIPFGYFYVCLGHVLTCLLARMGVVEQRSVNA
jgi:hypothetical protein